MFTYFKITSDLKDTILKNVLLQFKTFLKLWKIDSFGDKTNLHKNMCIDSVHFDLSSSAWFVSSNNQNISSRGKISLSCKNVYLTPSSLITLTYSASPPNLSASIVKSKYFDFKYKETSTRSYDSQHVRFPSNIKFVVGNESCLCIIVFLVKGSIREKIGV